MANLCAMCDEPIDDENPAHPDAYVGTPDGPRQAHPECGLRSVMGGYGHHVDHAYWCGQMNDPDGGLTYRESAKKVWELLR